jgi:DMSO/TMAO reductase YedYZ heme-binding membrane subunit
MRVVAAVMVVMPINALLGFTLGINPVFGNIISLCINLYALYLLYQGLTGALKTTPAKTKTAMYVLAALLLIFTLAGLGTSNRVNKIMKNINQDQSMNTIDNSR